MKDAERIAEAQMVCAVGYIDDLVAQIYIAAGNHPLLKYWAVPDGEETDDQKENEVKKEFFERFGSDDHASVRCGSEAEAYQNYIKALGAELAKIREDEKIQPGDLFRIFTEKFRSGLRRKSTKELETIYEESRSEKIQPTEFGKTIIERKL